MIMQELIHFKKPKNDFFGFLQAFQLKR